MHLLIASVNWEMTKKKLWIASIEKAKIDFYYKFNLHWHLKKFFVLHLWHENNSLSAICGCERYFHSQKHFSVQHSTFCSVPVRPYLVMSWNSIYSHSLLNEIILKRATVRHALSLKVHNYFTICSTHGSTYSLAELTTAWIICYSHPRRRRQTRRKKK